MTDKPNVVPPTAANATALFLPPDASFQEWQTALAANGGTTDDPDASKIYLALRQAGRQPDDDSDDTDRRARMRFRILAAKYDAAQAGQRFADQTGTPAPGGGFVKPKDVPFPPSPGDLAKRAALTTDTASNPFRGLPSAFRAALGNADELRKPEKMTPGERERAANLVLDGMVENRMADSLSDALRKVNDKFPELRPLFDCYRADLSKAGVS